MDLACRAIMRQRTVLYLDLDDTLISWASGAPVGGAGLRDFLLWALDAFEVRWLTRWARTGRMPPRLLRDLASLSGVPVERLAAVRGLSWHESDCKVNGVAWLEHVVLGRPFLWIEDEGISPACLDVLRRCGFEDRYRVCNVTANPTAVRSLHRELAALS